MTVAVAMAAVMMIRGSSSFSLRTTRTYRRSISAISSIHGNNIRRCMSAVSSTGDNNIGLLETLGSWKAHGGWWTRYAHASTSTKGRMTFSVFVPPNASAKNPAPVVFYLSGLTCTDENVVHKAGASRAASQSGVSLVCPDTSPRGAGVEGEDDGWDFGTGAGFYVDATREPWKSGGYAMETYIATELRGMFTSPNDEHLQLFPALDGSRVSVMGHSMGGHGALTLAFKRPEWWKSVSAFSPICHPTNCPWGIKAFTGYFAGGVEEGKGHDATCLVHAASRAGSLDALPPVLVDQGLSDSFFAPSQDNGPEGQLQPGALEKALQDHPSSVVRLHDGYDHSYHFISTFIDDHVEFHAMHLKK